jgi:hypothetical protein
MLVSRSPKRRAIIGKKVARIVQLELSGPRSLAVSDPTVVMPCCSCTMNIIREINIPGDVHIAPGSVNAFTLIWFHAGRGLAAYKAW